MKDNLATEVIETEKNMFFFFVKQYPFTQLPTSIYPVTSVTSWCSVTGSGRVIAIIVSHRPKQRRATKTAEHVLKVSGNSSVQVAWSSKKGEFSPKKNAGSNGFHSHGGTPIAGSQFLIHGKSKNKLDDLGIFRGIPIFRPQTWIWVYGNYPTMGCAQGSNFDKAHDVLNFQKSTKPHSDWYFRLFQTIHWISVRVSPSKNP